MMQNFSPLLYHFTYRAWFGNIISPPASVVGGVRAYVRVNACVDRYTKERGGEKEWDREIIPRTRLVLETLVTIKAKEIKYQYLWLNM